MTPCVCGIFAVVIRINIAFCSAARTVDHGVNVAPRKNVVFIGKRTVFFDGRVPVVAVGNNSILGCCVNSLGTGVDAVGFGIIIKFPAVAVEPERIFDFGFRHVIHGKRLCGTGHGVQARTPLGAADQMQRFGSRRAVGKRKVKGNVAGIAFRLHLQSAVVIGGTSASDIPVSTVTEEKAFATGMW